MHRSVVTRTPNVDSSNGQHALRHCQVGAGNASSGSNRCQATPCKHHAIIGSKNRWFAWTKRKLGKHARNTRRIEFLDGDTLISHRVRPNSSCLTLQDQPHLINNLLATQYLELAP